MSPRPPGSPRRRRAVIRAGQQTGLHLVHLNHVEHLDPPPPVPGRTSAPVALRVDTQTEVVYVQVQQPGGLLPYGLHGVQGDIVAHDEVDQQGVEVQERFDLFERNGGHMVGKLLDFLHVFVVTDPVPAGPRPGKGDAAGAYGGTRVQYGAHGVVTLRADAADGEQFVAFADEVGHYGDVVQNAAEILNPAAVCHEDGVVVDEADDADAHGYSDSVSNGRFRFPELNGRGFDHPFRGDAAHAVVGPDGTTVSAVGTAGPAVQGRLDNPVSLTVRSKAESGYRGSEDGYDGYVHGGGHVAHAGVVGNENGATRGERRRLQQGQLSGRDQRVDAGVGGDFGAKRSVPGTAEEHGTITVCFVETTDQFGVSSGQPSLGRPDRPGTHAANRFGRRDARRAHQRIRPVPVLAIRVKGGMNPFRIHPPRSEKRQVAFDFVDSPVGDPLRQQQLAGAPVETHPDGHTGQATEQCASERPVGYQRRIVGGAAQPTGEAKQFQGPLLPAILVVDDDVVDVGIVPEQVRRFRPHDGPDAIGAQPRPGRFEQRSGQHDVAHECGLYDEYAQPAGYPGRNADQRGARAITS